MTPLNPEFEERRDRAYAQLDLLKDSIRARHQSLVTIAVGSVAMLVVATFIQMSFWLSIAIAGVLLVNIVVWWFDILMVRKSLLRSTEILHEVLPNNKANIEEINSKTSWLIQNFQEIAAGFCTLIVLFLIFSLFAMPAQSDQGRHPALSVIRHPAELLDKGFRPHKEREEPIWREATYVRTLNIRRADRSPGTMSHRLSH